VRKQIALRATLAPAAKPGHPVAEVGEKALPTHLAVVHDVDPRLDLARYDRLGGRMSEDRKSGLVHFVASCARRMYCRELTRPRKAASMRGQDAAVAPLHGFWSPCDSRTR